MTTIETENTSHDDVTSETANSEEIGATWVKVDSNQDLPKTKTSVECSFPGTDYPIKCKILSRAGKTSTNNWHYLNIIQDGESTGKCCSFKDASWRPCSVDSNTSNNFHVDIFHGSTPNDMQFDKAKQDEIQKWIDFKTFVEVPETGQNSISTRWVCTKKIKGN